MALSTEDRQQIREIIQDCMAGVNARTESSYTVLSSKVDGVNLRLDKINGRINKHDDKLLELETVRNSQHQKIDDWFDNYDKNHIALCPQSKRIADLETHNKVNMSLKSFVIGSFIFLFSMIGAVYSTIKIVEAHDSKKITTEQPILPK